jgi:cytochrome P450
MVSQVAGSVPGGARRGAARSLLPGSDALDEIVPFVRATPRFLHTRHARHGPVFRSRILVPVVFAAGEEASRAVLVTHRDHFSEGRGYQRTSIRWVFEGSIMLLDGEPHARMRETLTPAVGRLAVRESAEHVRAIWERSIAATSAVRSEDVYQLAERTTFHVAANVLAGLALGPQTEAFRPLFEQLVEGMMVHVPVRLPFGRLHRSLRARAALVDLLRPHVLRARERDPVGLVGQLAHARDEDGALLSVEAIVGHVNMLAWAGYDTTASQLSWVLLTLAHRPDWQARLRDELATVEGDPAALESGARTPQLEAFLHEIERMYPSVLIFPRVATADVELAGRIVPADTLVFWSPYMSHRDPELYDNPNALEPDRWLGDRARRPSPARLVGFGAGPRVCLGKAFAKLQLRLAIRAILRDRRVQPDPSAPGTVQHLPVHHPVGARVFLVPPFVTP